MSRLTDEEIDRLLLIADTHSGGITMSRTNARMALLELRERRAADAIAVSDGSAAVVTLGTKSLDAMLASERRAADLTAEDVEALTWAREEIGELRLDEHEHFDRALSILDRLLNQKAGG